MKFFKKGLKRALCLMVTLSIVLSSLCCPIAFAEETAAASGDLPRLGGLQLSDFRLMHYVDSLVQSLTDSVAYAGYSLEQRYDAAMNSLQMLASRNLIRKDSILYDPDTGMLSFSYACGILGGILLDETRWDQGPDTLADLEALADSAAPLAETNGLEQTNGRAGRTAAIYYGFDDPQTSSRYPYYQAMQRAWTASGLRTELITDLTVSRMEQIKSVDLCVIGTHGIFYTYKYGTLRRRTLTAPVLILPEKSTFWRDISYAGDLINHRVIKINGAYCLMPSFFTKNYKSGAFENTIIFSEACEFFGYIYQNTALADAFLDLGAAAVIGFDNTVYTIYSRSILVDFVDQLLKGATAQYALLHARSAYGADDVAWYRSKTTQTPHALSSRPYLMGDGSRVLSR